MGMAGRKFPPLAVHSVCSDEFLKDSGGVVTGFRRHFVNDGVKYTMHDGREYVVKNKSIRRVPKSKMLGGANVAKA